MRRVFLLAMIAAASICHGQSLDGFMGIKFGSSKDSVKKVMLSKRGCVLDTKHSTPDNLFFEGVKFAGRETVFISFRFVDNKFHTSAVVISPDLESEAIKLYETIQKEIEDKYYITDEKYENYKYPYEKGDGHAETAIKLGKADFSTYWRFKNTNDPSVYNYLALEITTTLSVRISYQDGVLVHLAEEKEKAINSKDY